MGRCRNAYDVFPPELVEEIQKHFSGGVLWIPKDYESRNRKICELKRDGFTAREIAGQFGLSANQVRGILRIAARRNN